MNIHVKKEEEDRDSDDHNSNNNYDGTATDTTSRKSCGFEQVKAKKEEEEEEKEDDGNNNNHAEINNCSSNRKNADDDDDDYYTDWTSGNWGWLLPTSTTTCSNTNTNANANNTAIPSATPSRTSSSGSRKRTVSSRSRNATSVMKKDTPKNKKTRLLPPPPPPSNNEHATTVKQEEEEEDSVCYNDEVNNKANDDDDDDDDGYESWTEGNWCLILPTGSSSSTRTVANIKYTKNQNKNWNEMFRRLVSYKKQHNSMVVPYVYIADPKLGRWVNTQRYKKNPISEHRVNLLDSIGFVWNAQDNQWDEMFQKLVAYKNQHNGSMSFPSRDEADIQLGTWVCTQRHRYSIKTISVHRIERLESIGFVWNERYAKYACVLDGKWMEMYDQLVAYKIQHKSTQVPRTYTCENNDMHLGRWVMNQRNAYNRGKLLEKRKDLLNSIDFVWRLKSGPR